MRPDPIIFTVEEPDGRWLAYCEQYCVASYGSSCEDALEKNRNMVTEVSRDPGWLASNIVIPELDDEDSAGPELIKVTARWTGIPEDSFYEEE
jgi:hypothetical protein